MNWPVRIAYSFAINWRSYLMSCDTEDCTLLFNRELVFTHYEVYLNLTLSSQDCYFMTLFVCFWSTSSAFLAAMTSYLRLLHKYSLYFITWILNLRFLYVRTSTQAHITTVLKRSSYVYRIMLVGLFYQLVNVNMLYQDYNGPGEARSNILLYQACYNPWAHFSKSLFKMIGISEIMVLALGWLNISCNIFLYRFLESHRKNNVAGNMKQIKWYDRSINQFCYIPMLFHSL